MSDNTKSPAMNTASPTEATFSCKKRFSNVPPCADCRAAGRCLGVAAPVGQGSATSGEAAAIKPWLAGAKAKYGACLAGLNQKAIEEISIPFMLTEIADLRAALAASAEQSNTPLDGYGDTDCGFTFSGIQLEAGDKRLASLIVRALGTAHPAMDDLIALLFRARPAPAAEQSNSAVAQKVEITREGRMFWHTNCPVNRFKSGVMQVASNEPARSLIQCQHCGKCGYYPVGGTGTVCSDEVQVATPVAERAAAPASVPEGRMPAKVREWIQGMTVSMDVSTGDHDAEHRYFGVVSEVMDCPGDKHDVTLLVYDAAPNFTAPEVAQPAAQGEPVMLNGTPLSDHLENTVPESEIGDEWTKGFEECKRRLFRIVGHQLRATPAPTAGEASGQKGGA